MRTDAALRRGSRSAMGQRRRALVMLRFTSIIATSYLVLAEVGLRSVPLPTILLIGLALLSNFGLKWVPDAFFGSSKGTAALMLLDSAIVTGVLLSTGRFGSEFFYLYFFVLFLAGIGESVKLVVSGAVVTCAAYLVLSSGSGELSFDWSAPALLRLPFFLAVASFYGYLVDRVRQEHRKACNEAAAADDLRTAQASLAEHAARLETANSDLAREIDERRLAEERLRLANEELHRLSEAKSDFVAMVAHEVKGPLTGLRGALDVLRRGRAGPLDEPQERFVGLAYRSTMRLRRITGDLLDLSKIEAGRLEYDFGTVDLRRLCEDLAHEHRPEADARSLLLRLVVEDAVPPVRADAHRIAQVLTNLITNAMKFTPTGGRIEIGLRPEGARVALWVRDSGVGLTVEQQARIFERFYQVDGDRETALLGTGLGLCISKQLVEAHGSRLEVESEPGRGSRFGFSLSGLPKAETAVSAGQRPELARA